jgi:DNA-binding MarR family transcriptional regulator
LLRLQLLFKQLFCGKLEGMEERLERKQLQAWRNFITAQANLVDLIGRELEEAGCLPLSWYDVLVALVEAPERRLRMNELAREVVLSRSGLTRLVDRLEKEGYLRRERVGGDRRGLYAVLTLQGFRAFRRTWPVYEQSILSHFTRHLNDQEQEVITTAFGRLLKLALESEKKKTVSRED